MSIREILTNYMDKRLDKLQEKVNKKYEEQGLTKKVLKTQLYINKTRNKFNIPDKSEMIYEEFVQ